MAEQSYKPVAKEEIDEVLNRLRDTLKDITKTALPV